MINVNQITSELAKMPDQALQQYAALHKNDPYMVTLALSESNRRKQMRMGAQGAGVMPQPKVVDQDIAGMAQEMPENVGIGQLPAPNMQGMAGGGIVAFDDGGSTTDKTNYRQYAIQRAKQLGLNPQLVDNIFKHESGYDPTAKSGTGPVGIGQLSKFIARSVFGQRNGIDPTSVGKDNDGRLDPIKNIDTSLDFMAHLNRKYKGDPTKVAVAYNQGETVLDKHLKENEGKVVPQDLPSEARKYISKTLTNLMPFGSANAEEILRSTTTGSLDADTQNKILRNHVPRSGVSAASKKGIETLTDDGNYTDPMTGFSIPQDVYSPTPAEERNYAAAQAQAEKVEDVVSQIPGQSVKAPAYKDTNTYFGGIADRLGIPLEAQRNIANTINATSGFTAPVGGINRAAKGIAKGLEPTAEMIQKAAQAKQIASTERLLPPAKAGLEALDETSAATRAAAENARRLRQLEEDRKAAVGAEQSVEAATKTANIADKTAKEIAVAQDAARLNQTKMTGAAQSLAGVQAIDKAGGTPDQSAAPTEPKGGIPDLNEAFRRFENNQQNKAEDVQVAKPEAAPEAIVEPEAKKGGTDWNDFMIKMGLNLMASKDPNAISGVGQAGLGTLAMQQAEAKAKSEDAYREAMGKHYTMPSASIQELEWARDPNNIKLLRQIAQAKADPKSSAQEALAFLKDAGVVLKETDPVLYNVLRNKALGSAVPQVQEGAGLRN